MKLEVAEGVASNAVSGVARQRALNHIFFYVGLARAGFFCPLPSPPMQDSDKASVSPTGSSPAYPLARQTILIPLEKPHAGQNGAQSSSYPKITPLLPTVRTVPEVGLNSSFTPTPPSDFRPTHHTGVET